MRLLLATALVTFTLSAAAGTVIENKDDQGEISRVSIEGGWARFDGADKGEKGYMLVDLEAAKFYAVAPPERTIIEFSPRKEKKEQEKGVKAEFKKVGPGPEVAGYATDKYELTADGKSCGFFLMSESVAEIGDVKELLARLGGLTPDAFVPEEMRQGLPIHRDPCEVAKMELGKEAMVREGYPMKMLDPKGETVEEVTAVKTGVELDPALFELPKGYSRTTVKEMMEGMRKEMEAARDEIERMMKEMSPEERARMEQMMKQFGNMP